MALDEHVAKLRAVVARGLRAIRIAFEAPEIVQEVSFGIRFDGERRQAAGGFIRHLTPVFVVQGTGFS
jgi:hypothetical protein